MGETQVHGLRKTVVGSKRTDGFYDEAILAVSGSYQVMILDPDDANAADANAERFDDATGCLAFRITPLSPSAASVDALIFGWSTTASDLAAINTAMATIDADIATPGTNATFAGNVGVLIPSLVGATNTEWRGSTDWVLWDGATTIKTIAVRSSGADYAEGALLEMIIPV